MLLLFVVTFALYARSANFPFTVLDDALYVFRNSHVASGLSIASIRWAFTSFHASNWHPVTWLSLMTDSQLWGLNPMGFHLVNVLLHALNASLLFLLLYKMTGALKRSALVAALFALHPLHVESVVWITERKDVLSFLLLLLTLFCYLAYVRSSRRIWYLSALVVYAVGLMAKPMLVTLPLLLALCAGSATAIISAVLIARACGASLATQLSLAPKSVTTPIAMGISENIGGIPSLTAALVIVTGIVGAVGGRSLFRLLGVRDDAVKGFAMGIAAHGIGTARAFQESETMGAFSALAMGLNGLLTALLVPLLIHWML